MALIQVTQDMIDAGVRKDPGRCALAYGIRSHLNGRGDVSVGYDIIEFSDLDPDGFWRVHSSISTPIDCQRFADTFDRGVAKPFTTHIPIPLSLLRVPLT
jgi:hypothetical protein